MIPRYVIVGFVTLFTIATPAWSQQVDPAPVAGQHSLQPGDAIEVAISREIDLNGIYPVDEQGVVVLPLIGPRQVMTAPPSELRREILDAYAEQVRNQAVRVTLLRRVRVLGAVQQPGLYRVDPTMTVVDAVALAGGATAQGRLSEVRIFRDGQRIDSSLELSTLQSIRSGDQIVVPERGWFSRNAGIVVGATLSVVGILVASSR